MPDEDRPFGFRLPPFRLPEFFPDDFEVVFPGPGRVRGHPVGTRWVLAMALLVDLADALLALTVSGPALLARSFAVFVFSLVLTRVVGLIAVWELVAVLSGSPLLTVAPSVIVLVVVRARYIAVDA